MSIPFSQAESFRSWLEKAIRVDDNIDWTPHTVDYGLFKVLLKGMARRRVKLRKLLREAPNGRLSNEALHQVLVDSLLSPSIRNSVPGNMRTDVMEHSSTDLYPASQRSSLHGTPPPAAGHDTNLFPKGDFTPPVTTRTGGRASLPDGRRPSERLSPPDRQYHSMDNVEISASSDAESSQPSIPGTPAVSGGALFNKTRSKRSTMRKVSSHERSEMISFLLWEMDKVQLFYHSQWQQLSAKLEELTGHPNKQTSASWMENAVNGPIETSEATLLGEEILELFAFCVINVVTVCQILIRYDGYARTFEGTPMLDYFTKQVVKHPTAFRKILHHEELIALADSFQQLVAPSKSKTIAEKPPVDEGIDPIPMEETSSAFEAQRAMFISIINTTSSAQSLSMDLKTDLADSFIKTLRFWIEFGTYEDQLGLEPAFLTMRGKSLTGEMKLLAEWRSRKTNQHNAVLPPTHAEKATLSGSQVFNLTLNLISAFLYCMNYYIVEPSSTMYANRLHAHDAMSGTLIGMMPLAAFVSSIPFSMWTNYSFRQPLIMSCSLLLVGNLLYSLADQTRQVEYALLGRFISGLGAPKCIIRRFLADTTPLSLRTSVNASFGMVVAAGSAMGPAMAVLLAQIEVVAIVPFVGFVTFNGLTMPGYFMAALWATFLVIVLLTFEEPNRDGLEEQKRLEAQKLDTSYHKEGDFLSTSVHERESKTAEQLAKELAKMDSVSSQHRAEIEAIFSSENLPEASEDAPDRTLHITSSGDSSPFLDESSTLSQPPENPTLFQQVTRTFNRVLNFFDLVTLPVRICLGLLFAKVFTIEALVSATSALSKNRYQWQVQQVGTLGFVNGCLVIPFSILIGRLSLVFQDQKLMRYLIAFGCCGFLLLIDISDLMGTPSSHYNQGHPLAVGPERYIAGYFVTYLSIQAFEGVIGSTLSKVIPTALASGTFNSGLLATLVDTLGRSSGDMFISSMGFISLRQLMNLLFIPGFLIMLICLFVIERYRDLLAV